MGGFLSSEEDANASKDALGTRMKKYEEAAYTQKFVPRGQYMVARIDGHKFSKFTKGFTKPFDERFSTAMQKTTEDLLQKFDARFGYTESDEITLMWQHPENPDATYPFNGRILKMASLLAGYTSARFNVHINAIKFTEKESNLRAKVRLYEAHFDARVFGLPSEAEVLNNIIWRCLYDCRRNAISGAARYQFGHKACHKLNSKELHAKMETEGKSWDSYPLAFRFGSFVKKELYGKEYSDPKTGKTGVALRGRVLTKHFKFSGFSEENIDMVLRKYWNPEFVLANSEDHQTGE